MNAARDHDSGEVGTGAGDGATGQDTGTAWVNRSTDCPEAPAQAHLLGPDGFTRLAGDEAYDRLHGVDGHVQAATPRYAPWRGIRCRHEECAEFGICLVGPPPPDLDAPAAYREAADDA
jgi:hypothetical protein